MDRVQDFSDPTTINKIEKDPQTGLPYVWTRDDTYFVFDTLPRFLPISVTIDLNLQRPDGEAPAHLEINEVDQSTYKLVQPIATFDYDPKQPGFHTYTLTIPARTSLVSGLDLEFKSNSFGVPGDSRVLGVTVRDFIFKANGDPYSSLLTPYPIGVAVALLLIIMASWFRMARLGWVESAIFLGMIGIVCAEQVQFLRVSTWLLIACAIGMAACLVGWWLTHRSPGKARFEIYWLLAAVAMMIIFLLPGDDFSFDTNLYRDWMGDVMKYGPIDFYAHSPSFNYLPLIIYIFWVYGNIMALFGYNGGDSIFFRSFMSLIVLAACWLIYRLVWPGTSKVRQVAIPVVMLFGLNITVLYNPTIWGQADVLLGFMLLLNFWLLHRRRWLLAGIMLGLCVLFKPQAIFVVPLFAVVLLKQAGWRKAGLGIGLGGIICTALALPSFGFRWSEIHQYLFQEQLVGQYVMDGTIRAYNLPFLNQDPAQVSLITNVGLGIIALTFAALALYLWKGRTEPGTIAMAAALGVTTFFAFSIKMHERYLYYALPFLALAVAYAWKERPGWFAWMTSWFTAVYSLVALLQMLVSRHVDLSGQIEESLFNWNYFLIQNRTLLESAMSYTVIGLYVWGSGLFWLGAWLNRQSRLDRIIRPAVPVKAPVEAVEKGEKAAFQTEKPGKQGSRGLSEAN